MQSKLKYAKGGKITQVCLINMAIDLDITFHAELLYRQNQRPYVNLVLANCSNSSMFIEGVVLGCFAKRVRAAAELRGAGEKTSAFSAPS